MRPQQGGVCVSPPAQNTETKTLNGVHKRLQITSLKIKELIIKRHDMAQVEN